MVADTEPTALTAGHTVAEVELGLAHTTAIAVEVGLAEIVAAVADIVAEDKLAVETAADSPSEGDTAYLVQSRRSEPDMASEIEVAAEGSIPSKTGP